jgi:hypothetical protein
MDRGMMQISQPPCLPDLTPAEVCLFHEVRTCPFHNKKWNSSEHQQDQHNCQITGTFLFGF